MRLKDGRIVIISSDNIDYDGTYNVYDANDLFDPELTVTEVIHESQVECIDSNWWVINNLTQ